MSMDEIAMKKSLVSQVWSGPVAFRHRTGSSGKRSVDARTVEMYRVSGLGGGGYKIDW